MPENLRVLVLCSSSDVIYDKLGAPRECGIWAEELVSAWQVFQNLNVTVRVCTPDGRPVPIEPQSLTVECGLSANELSELKSFLFSHRDSLRNPESLLTEGNIAPFDGIFIPGGYGPLAQLADDAATRYLIARCLDANVPFGAVCHGPAAFLSIPDSERLHGIEVTGFSESEEMSSGNINWVPYVLERSLRDRGMTYKCAPDWMEHVMVCGSIVTGQNPASSSKAALELTRLMKTPSAR